MKKKNGLQFFENALNYVTSKFEEIKEKGNIIDYFLNYVVAHEYDAIQHGIWEDSNTAYEFYESTLYGYPLGVMILDMFEMSDGKEFYSPESLYVRKNLQRLSVGAFLLQKLMKDMYEKHPDESLVSPTVMMSNVNALKLYNRFGATVYVNGNEVEDPINGMDHSRKENCLVVFFPDAIEKNAKRTIDKPIERINQIKGRSDSLKQNGENKKGNSAKSLGSACVRNISFHEIQEGADFLKSIEYRDRD